MSEPRRAAAPSVLTNSKSLNATPSHNRLSNVTSAGSAKPSSPASPGLAGPSGTSSKPKPVPHALVEVEDYEESDDEEDEDLALPVAVRDANKAIAKDINWALIADPFAPIRLPATFVTSKAQAVSAGDEPRLVNGPFGPFFVRPDGSKSFPLLPRGAPTFERVDPGMSLWDRSTVAYNIVRERGFPGLPHMSWHDTTSAKDVADASDEGWKGAKPTLRAAVEMMPNEEGFVSGDFWMSLAPHRVNSIIRVKELQKILSSGGKIADLFRVGREHAAGAVMSGIYVGVGLKGEPFTKECRLATDYIGQSWDIPVRGGQHCIGIVEEAALKLFYQLAALCDIFLLLPLYVPSPGLAVQKIPRTLSILEGKLSLLFGSYTRKEVFLEIRRQCGLPEFKGVAGGNATPCLEHPQSSQSPGELYVVRNEEYVMAADRLNRQRKLLARAVAKGSPSAHAHLEGLQRAQTVLDNVLGQLINAGVVRIRSDLQNWLQHHVPEKFIRQMTEFFGTEQDWVLELVEGQGSSLASVTYEDRAYFEDLAIFGKSSDPTDLRRVLWREVLPLKKKDKDSTRRFWMRMARFKGSYGARHDRYQARCMEVQNSHLDGFQELRPIGQDAVDGHVWFCGGGTVTLEERGKVCKSNCMPALQKAGNLSFIRPSDGRVNSGKDLAWNSCPLRIRKNGPELLPCGKAAWVPVGHIYDFDNIVAYRKLREELGPYLQRLHAHESRLRASGTTDGGGDEADQEGGGTNRRHRLSSSNGGEAVEEDVSANKRCRLGSPDGDEAAREHGGLDERRSLSSSGRRELQEQQKPPSSRRHELQEQQAPQPSMRREHHAQQAAPSSTRHEFHAQQAAPACCCGVATPTGTLCLPLMALFLVGQCPGQITPPPLFYQALAMLQSSHPGTPPPQFFWSLCLLLQGRVSPPAPTFFSALNVLAGAGYLPAGFIFILDTRYPSWRTAGVLPLSQCPFASGQALMSTAFLWSSSASGSQGQGGLGSQGQSGR